MTSFQVVINHQNLTKLIHKYTQHIFLPKTNHLYLVLSI